MTGTYRRPSPYLLVQPSITATTPEAIPYT
jgi:hypothetical protein